MPLIYLHSDFVLRHATHGVYVQQWSRDAVVAIYAHNLGEDNFGEPGDTLKVLHLQFFLVRGDSSPTVMD